MADNKDKSFTENFTLNTPKKTKEIDIDRLSGHKAITDAPKIKIPGKVGDSK